MERWVKLRRLGAVNMGKNMAATMGLFGLVYALFIFFFMALGMAGASRAGGAGAWVAGIGLGVGAFLLVALPLLFAAFGFVYGVIIAAAWNLILPHIDGLHLLLEFPEEAKRK